jgi:hypothetical protein
LLPQPRHFYPNFATHPPAGAKSIHRGDGDPCAASRHQAGLIAVGFMVSFISGVRLRARITECRIDSTGSELVAVIFPQPVGNRSSTVRAYTHRQLG